MPMRAVSIQWLLTKRTHPAPRCGALRLYPARASTCAPQVFSAHRHLIIGQQISSDNNMFTNAPTYGERIAPHLNKADNINPKVSPPGVDCPRSKHTHLTSTRETSFPTGGRIEGPAPSRVIRVYTMISLRL